MEPHVSHKFLLDSASVKSGGGISSSVVFKLGSWASWHLIEIGMEEERTVNKAFPALSQPSSHQGCSAYQFQVLDIHKGCFYLNKGLTALYGLDLRSLQL